MSLDRDDEYDFRRREVAALERIADSTEAIRQHLAARFQENIERELAVRMIGTELTAKLYSELMPSAISLGTTSDEEPKIEDPAPSAEGELGEDAHTAPEPAPDGDQQA